MPASRRKTGIVMMRFGRAGLAALLVALFACVWCRAGYAASSAQPSLAEGLSYFTAGSFDQTKIGIEKTEASGSPRAAIVLRALDDSELMFSAARKEVYIQDASGKLFDPATGRAVPGPAPADLDNVNLDNLVRGELETALATLNLLAPDAATRYAAAQTMFQSPQAAALPTLDQAIGRETNTGVKRALEQAHAAIILITPHATDAQRLAAIAVVRDRGGNDSLAVLANISPPESPAIARAASAAIGAIKTGLVEWGAVQNAWYGISLGAVLLLAAIGLAITFGVMGVINMAHGEMVMLGAYVTFAVQQVIRAYDPALFDYSLAIAVPLALLVSGIAGILIERSIIRFLYGRPLETLLATWGLSLVLQQAVRTVFGADNRDVGTPSFMTGAFKLGGISVDYDRLWIVCFTLVVFAALIGILRFTRLGLEIRAVTQNRAMAASMGIRTSRVDALTFGLGSAIAGIAGVALSQIDNVSPNLGQHYIVDSFMVVVFGGVGNLWGTFVGAFVIGIANKFLEPYAGAVVGEIAILVLIILFIQKRPRGLFALKGRAVEA